MRLKSSRSFIYFFLDCFDLFPIEFWNTTTNSTDFKFDVEEVMKKTNNSFKWNRYEIDINSNILIIFCTPCSMFFTVWKKQSDFYSQ